MGQVSLTTSRHAAPVRQPARHPRGAPHRPAKRSAVIVTAAEWGAGADPTDETGRPHLGEANVYVTNIGPHDPEGGAGGVEFFLHVDFDSPLHVQVTITVLDPIENFLVAD